MTYQKATSEFSQSFRVFKKPSSLDAILRLASFSIESCSERRALPSLFGNTAFERTRLGRSFFTLTTSVDADPYGWLLIDYHLLAEYIHTTCAHLEAHHDDYIALELHGLSTDETAELLRLGLETILPPASGWAPAPQARDTWQRVERLLGLPEAHEHTLRVYRIPHVFSRGHLNIPKCVRIDRFMSLCAKMDRAGWVGTLPYPLSNVVQLCGFAYTNRCGHFDSPPDTFHLSWTPTHLLSWQFDHTRKWDHYRYALDQPIELDTKQWFDWQGPDEHAEMFGLGQSAKQLLGLKLADRALDDLTQKLERLYDAGLGIAKSRWEDVRVVETALKRKKRKRTRLTVPQVQGLELDAQQFNARFVPSQEPVRFTLAWLKWGKDIYVGLPPELVGRQGLGDVSTHLRKVADNLKKGLRTATCQLSDMRGDPIKPDDRDRIEHAWTATRLPQRAVYSHPEGVFVRWDCWDGALPFGAVLDTLYRHYGKHHTVSVETHLRLMAFKAVLRWIRKGAFEEGGDPFNHDREKMQRLGVMYPRWMCALHGGIKSKHVADTPQKRMKFLTEASRRLEMPWLAWEAHIEGHRAPTKCLVELFLADYMKYLLSEAQSHWGFRLSASEARLCLTSIVCPWAKPQGFNKINMKPPAHPAAVTYSNDKPEDIRVLVSMAYEAIHTFLPPWAENGAHSVAFG